MIAQVLDPTGYQFSPYAVPTLLTALAIVLLGVGVLVRERITPVSVSFSALTAVIAVWLFGFSAMYSALRAPVALWWAHAAYAGIPLIPPAVYQFTVVVTGAEPRFRPVAVANWALGILFADLAAATDVVFGGVARFAWGYYPAFTWGSLVFLFWFGGVLLAAMAHYASAYRRAAPGTPRLRLRAIMGAFGIGYLGVGDFAAALGVPLYPFGYIAILGFIGLAARAIRIYRLIDITPAFAAGGILSTMVDALLVLDADGVVRLTNRAAEDLLRRDHTAIVGRPFAELLPDPATMEQIHHVQTGGVLRNHELPLWGARPTPRYVSLSASAVRGARGEAGAVVCVLRDVTETRRAQEQITTLFAQLRDSHRNLALAYDTTLRGWSHALDLRDRETEGHSQRVTELTCRLARALGVPESAIPHLERGALLHDIGKMGVPDAILLKPGPLTDEEWVIMRRHPRLGYELLEPIPFLRPALDIPYCHHERWDGRGYPRGLQGEEIPLAARIFAVVDVWDALSYDRPYRAAWPAERVRAHIQAGAGTHFDPRVVEAFLRLDAAPAANRPAHVGRGSQAAP